MTPNGGKLNGKRDRDLTSSLSFATSVRHSVKRFYFASLCGQWKVWKARLEQAWG